MSRRIGTKEAKGEYTAFLDGDDYLDEDFIQTLYDLAIKNNADVVSSGIRIVNNNVIEYANDEDSIMNGISFICSVKECNHKLVSILNNKLIRRTIWDSVEYSSRRYIEDTQTCYFVLYYTKIAVTTKYVGYNYVQNSDSLCHQSNEDKDIIYRALCAKDILMFVQQHKKEDYKYAFNAFLERIQEVKTILFTDTVINKYKDELSELFVFMLQLIKF